MANPRALDSLALEYAHQHGRLRMRELAKRIRTDVTVDVDHPGTRMLVLVWRAATPLVGIPGSALCGKMRAAFRHRTSAISSSSRPTASSARSFASHVSIVMSQ